MSEEEIIGKLGSISVNSDLNGDSLSTSQFDVESVMKTDPLDDRKSAAVEENEPIYYQDLMTEEFESNDTRLSGMTIYFLLFHKVFFFVFAELQ